jgi:hypothetical protein
MGAKPLEEVSAEAGESAPIADSCSAASSKWKTSKLSRICTSCT